MKKNGLMKTLKAIVTFDNNTELRDQCTENDLKLITMKELIAAGESASP